MPLPQIGVAYEFSLALIDTVTGGLRANPTLAAGDVKVSKDHGAFANVTTLPTVSPAAGVDVRVQLSATEMTVTGQVDLHFKDAAGAEWDEVFVTVQPLTYLGADNKVLLSSSAQTGVVIPTVTLTNTLTTYTGNTLQTGDSFARLGAPAGASVSADILVLDNLVDDLESRVGTPSNLGSGATVAANLVDIENQTDDIGVAGAGLTAIPTIATVTTVTNVTTVNGLAANVITAASLAADAGTEIAAAVWNEDATGHQTQGTFGQAIGDPVADTNTIYKAVVTDATGATVGVDTAAVRTELGTAGAGLTNINLPNQTMDIVGTITGNITGNLSGSVGSVTGAVGSVAANGISASSLATDAVAEIADGVWDEDATGHQTQGTFGQAIGDPVADTGTLYKAVVTDATGATIGLDVAAILVDTAEIGTAGAGLTAINLPNQAMDIIGNITGNLSGSVGSVTGAVGSIATGGIAAASFAAGAIDAAAIAADAIGASELAASAVTEIQTAVGVALTAADIRTAVGLASANLDTQLGAIDDFLDIEVLAIKTKTDALPADPADASDIAASFASLAATLATIAGYIDTEIAAIKAKTDLLPASPAAVGSAMTLAANAIAAATLAADALAVIKTQVTDALAVDTYAEPGQEAPAATTSLVKKIGYLYKFMRNRRLSTSGAISIYNDAATVVDQKAPHSDDGATYDKSTFIAGP